MLRSNRFLALLLIPGLVCGGPDLLAAGSAKKGAEAPAAPVGWPREVVAGDTTFMVYQPQIEVWDGFRTVYRAAISAKAGQDDTPIYGVSTFSARTEVDRGDRLVTFGDLKIETLRFPSAADRQAAWMTAIQKQVAPVTRTLDLDRFEAALAVLQAEAGQKDEGLPLRHDAPRIVFSTTKAMLIVVDGAAVYRPVADTKLQRVLNTRPLLLKDEKGQHFLKLYDGWVAAPALEGPYAVAKKTPKDLKKALKASQEKKDADLLQGGDPEDKKTQPTLKDGAPRVVVATSPTEVIVTEGEANYVAIAETQLLYIANTTGNVFKHLKDQKSYVLVSGRWFRAPSPEGPWEHVPNDALPEDFAKIPDDSAKENVKASVSGTPQAEEALIANSIPQTAAVRKSTAKMTPPVIDGPPQLKPIEGTTLQYVANSPTTIIVASPTSYYAVQDGVWFTASSTAGPWIVATSVPTEVYSIPASSPVHNVTYVKVYNDTPDVVYVGYTPGYYGTCVYSGTVVYGTGYPYTPWVGTYYYGAPMTYGYGAAVTYTPWTGWAVGFAFGWAYSAYGWGGYPYWGPYGGYYGGYGGYYGAGYGPRGGYGVWGAGGWAGTTGNVYSRWGSTTAMTRTSGGYNAWTGNAWASQVGRSYNSRTGVATAGQRGAVQNVYTGAYASGGRGVATGPGGGVAAGRGGTVGNAYTGREVSGGSGAVYNPRTGETTRVGGVSGDRGSVARVGDDVYAGRDGNVYRRGDGGGWEQAGSGGWQGVSDSSRTRSLDNQYSARSQGSQRSQQYRSGGYRSAGGGSRGGGGGRRR